MYNKELASNQTQSANIAIEQRKIDKQGLNIKQLDLPTQGQLEELSYEESNSVAGGFYFTYWNPTPNPLTPVILADTQAAQATFQVQNDNFLAWLSS